MKLHEKEIQSVLKLSSEKRFEYAMKRIIEQEEIWFLDDDGWVTYENREENIYLLPIWPAECFAKMNVVDNWINAQPEKLELEEFLLDYIPDLITQNIKIVIFPVTDSGITCEMDIISFCNYINSYSMEWYGESYDLPYLE
ncbi:DUF2750 domain-containing protein [Neisseria sp. Ec49-e6-T10]|uniref:DUF2750 domain-containing protein n=1 Tax=Neisseria sp. Ec49-e6-T10 TaxID=3140744 RepID=UPI003EBD2FD8